ncbi:OST-HTH/LOTUS domain-containing protein [Aeromonas veronii]|uniref:OST-HTH/LOTUS domain-containing protein n=1 Tax=Aeromonas veronii TaxID=654 RepID=UPI003D1BD0EB
MALVKKKTPSAFVSACDKFVYTEILSSQKPLDKTPDNIVNVGDGIKVPDILVQAIKAKIRDDGWARLASVGVYISQNHPSFDARNFGFDKLGELVKSQKYIEVKEVNDSSGEHSHIHVRLKSNV